MLRITIQENEASWRMRLEGKLKGEWVAEAARAWAGSPVGSRRAVDVTDVLCIDGAGSELLATMREAGAEFQAKGVKNGAILSRLSRVALLVLMAVVPLAAQTAEAPLRLTLQQAVDIALKQNPQVAIANLNIAASQEGTKIARSALLPQVSLSASDKVIRGNPQALLGRTLPGFPGHTGPFWVGQAGPSFSVPVFDFTAWRRWQAARETVHASEAQSTTARELNAQLVVSQYLGSLRAAADVKAAQSRLELSRALFALATDMQKSGVGTGIDTLRANVQVQNERQRLSEAEAQYSISLAGLVRLLNLKPEQTVELGDAGSFYETPAVDGDQSLAQALAARPEMRMVVSQIRTAELKKSAAKDQRLPKVSIGGAWNLQGVTPSTMIPTYQYGVSIDVPLYTGGRIQAETAEADIELKKLAQTETEIRNQIAFEVKASLTQIQAAQVQVEAANLGIGLAREGVTQAQDRFRAGVANNIEVITAQDELARANDNQIAALYRYNQARADLARATGRMEALYAK